MSGIVWLASYPKSGNTWVRAFLTNYLSDDDTPADINNLAVPIASARDVFDEVVGVEASDLTPTEIDRCRPDVYRLWCRDRAEPLFLKVHDAFLNADGQLLFPGDATLLVVYIIRHPFDVAVSFAHHSGCSVAESVSRMCRVHTLLGGPRAHGADQLPQTIGSWSSHVRSWLDESDLPCHVVRYEDLVRDPAPTFEALVRASGLPVDAARVDRAVAFSRFDRLQAQEQANGFRERSSRAATFFQSGQAGGWRDVLAPEDARQLLDAHGDIMRRFGYAAEPEATGSRSNDRGVGAE